MRQHARSSQESITMSPMTRRAALGGIVALGAALSYPRVVLAQAQNAPFKLDPLPFAANALEPHIDAKTMELHHGKHHAAYVEKLNKAVAEHSQLSKRPLHEILAKLRDVPEAVRKEVQNNGGGHANHTMFWQIMGPAGGPPQDNVGVAGQRPAAAASGPSGELAQAIERHLGGLEKFKADFNSAGEKQFGSGWVFVTVAKDGKLAIVTKPNQDTPLMEGKRVLMGNDVWEHAYYLTYQNRRPDYLKAWWNVVNWRKAEERFAAAKAGTLTI
jgi:Fe-Mn family superoxide dismutase